MAAIMIPAEVMLSNVPELLQARDICYLTAACKTWADHKQRLLKEHDIVCFFMAWSQLDTAECRATFQVLPHSDIQYLMKITHNLYDIQPCQNFWIFPNDWMSFILTNKDSSVPLNRKKLNFVEYVSVHTQEIHAHSKDSQRLQPMADNPTFYKAKYLSGVVAVLSNVMIDSFEGVNNEEDKAMYNNMQRRLHYKYKEHITPSQTEIAHTFEWVRTVFDWCNKHAHVDTIKDIDDIILFKHSQLLVRIMLDALYYVISTHYSNPRRLTINTTIMKYITNIHNGGIYVLLHDDYDQAFQDANLDWIYDTSNAIYDDIEYFKELAEYYHSAWYELYSLPSWF